MEPNEDRSQSQQYDKAKDFELEILLWVWNMIQEFYERGRKSDSCRREGNRVAIVAGMGEIWLHKMHEQEMRKIKCSP